MFYRVSNSICTRNNCCNCFTVIHLWRYKLCTRVGLLVPFECPTLYKTQLQIPSANPIRHRHITSLPAVVVEDYGYWTQKRLILKCMGQTPRYGTGKNLQLPKIPSNTPLYIATFNRRTLKSNDQLVKLELYDIKWDILGSCEQETNIQLKSGYIIYLYYAYLGGSAILLNRRIKDRPVKMHFISHRFIYIVMKISNMYNV